VKVGLIYLHGVTRK